MYDENKTHSNCVVYSNQKNISDINDVDLRNNFSLNLWINIRKNRSTSRGCVMHIPDVFSLYVIEGSEKFRFCITTGEDAKKTLNTSNFANIDFSNENPQSSQGIYLTDNVSFDYNNWYNITVNFNNISDDSYVITLYKNGIVNQEFNSVINREKNAAFNSYICLGNKPHYYRESQSNYNTDYDDIFYTFFGKEYSDDTQYEGPFYKKDLNLGSTSFSAVNNIEDIITNNNNIYFNDTIDENSSFNGEIHEIKIYSDTLS